VNFNKFLKFVKICWAILELLVYFDNGVLPKNSQATTKCDAERNWFIHDFIHHSKIDEKTGQQR